MILFRFILCPCFPLTLPFGFECGVYLTLSRIISRTLSIKGWRNGTTNGNVRLKKDYDFFYTTNVNASVNNLFASIQFNVDG